MAVLIVGICRTGDGRKTKIDNRKLKIDRDLYLGHKTDLLAIGAAAKKAGISRQSLQYYLMIGLIEPTEVTDTGRRMFDEQCVKRIKLVKKLSQSGYPLRAIRELFLEGRNDLKGSKK